MSSIGFDDGPPDYDRMREESERYDASWHAIEEPLRADGLPVPEHPHREIAEERLDLASLWRGLSEEEREQIGLVGLGLLVSGTMAARAENTAPAASRAYAAHYRAVEEELGRTPVPETVIAALRGTAWRIPADLGPVCRSCGCSEEDACPGGCGWEDARQIRCTACARPPLDVDIPF